MSYQFLRLVVENQRRRWRKLTEKEIGKYPIAHAGIQRSGTNYVCAVLEKADYRVVNRIDPPRNVPSHKHTRWQTDKTTVVMDSRYRTDSTAMDAEELNDACGHPADMKHLVIFRNPRDWLNSIYRWGLKNEWFKNEEEFFREGLHKKYLDEWHEFYGAWESIYQRSPDMVRFVAYDDLTSSPGDIILKIDKFAGVEREMPIEPLSVRHVRHSEPIQKKRIDLDVSELDEEARKGGAFNWEIYMLNASEAN